MIIGIIETVMHLQSMTHWEGFFQLSNQPPCPISPNNPIHGRPFHQPTVFIDNFLTTTGVFLQSPLLDPSIQSITLSVNFTMSTTMPSQSPSSSSEDTSTTIDSTPLLSPTSDGAFRSRQFVRGTPSLRGAARFLRRASSRRMLREPSMRVRESAAEQIEERQTDWAYSRPIVILDLIWNLAFIVVSISVLIMSRKENPKRPLRLWIVGYVC